MPYPIEEKYIIECETALNARLPNSYRQLMMGRNGGEVEAKKLWIFYPILNKKDYSSVYHTKNHLFAKSVSNSSREGFPEKGVGIAQDGEENQLLFLMDEEGNMAPEVYEWDHKTAELTKIADDFEVFSEFMQVPNYKTLLELEEGERIDLSSCKDNYFDVIADVDAFDFIKQFISKNVLFGKKRILEFQIFERQDHWHSIHFSGDFGYIQFDLHRTFYIDREGEIDRPFDGFKSKRSQYIDINFKVSLRYKEQVESAHALLLNEQDISYDEIAAGNCDPSITLLEMCLDLDVEFAQFKDKNFRSAALIPGKLGSQILGSKTKFPILVSGNLYSDIPESRELATGLNALVYFKGKIGCVENYGPLENICIDVPDDELEKEDEIEDIASLKEEEIKLADFVFGANGYEIIEDRKNTSDRDKITCVSYKAKDR